MSSTGVFSETMTAAPFDPHSNTHGSIELRVDNTRPLAMTSILARTNISNHSPSTTSLALRPRRTYISAAGQSIPPPPVEVAGIVTSTRLETTLDSNDVF